VHAQVLLQATPTSAPEVLDDSSVTVTYEAVADASGSINRTSIGKTNFWTHVLQLFGMAPEEDEGLLGQRMPGAANVPQTFAAYDAAHQWFTAAGIPITALDDALQDQPYPLLRITARSRASGRQLATLDVVVPASAEMHCSSCHSADGVAADAATAARWGVTAWSGRADAEQAYRENILLLHDAKHATDLMDSQPVLCASCHYSPALDLAGSGPAGPQLGKPMLSHAIHGRHGATLDNHLPTPSDPAVIPEVPTTSCYQCHPGSSTKCLRGAMGDAGISCQDCHGGLLAVGGKYLLSDHRTRTPWADEPRCASCHTGDAVSHVGADFRLLTAYDPADLGATPRQAPASRFAEQAGQLYRNSHGHGNLACEACHGSPHAIWPTGDDHPNDNVAAVQFQGHAGTLTECQSCHQQSLPLTLGGPHGMHNVNDARWNTGHEEFYERNPDACKACHGLALEGTALSRTAADRLLQTDEHGTLNLPKGTIVSCTLCHDAPDGGGDDDDDDD
jgi:hypothetical protein